MNEESSEGLPRKAIVTVPQKEGHRGPYFETECIGIGMVTVSLDPEVWLEGNRPEGGNGVLLMDIRWKRKGWRAYKARFLRPEDENHFQKAR